jgi:hypothetical protein
MGRLQICSGGIVITIGIGIKGYEDCAIIRSELNPTLANCQTSPSASVGPELHGPDLPQELKLRAAD